MSGIIPPSIVTYSYIVDNNFSKYINVSFPFRCLVQSVWFTVDERFLSGTAPSGTVFDSSGRTLKLAGLKAKNPKVILSSYDPPSDWAAFFGIGAPEEQTDWSGGDEAYKPNIWLGLPEDAPSGTYKDATTHQVGQPASYNIAFRSNSVQPPSLNDAHNPYWGNNGWNSSQFAANKYKTDMGVMNPDEVLSLFVYADDGDWTDYSGEGVATIHVAYTGIGEGVSTAGVTAPWSDWWYD